MASTKAELAEELGVSKSTVYNIAKRLELLENGHIERKGKTDWIDEDGCSLIAAEVDRNPDLGRRDNQTESIITDYLSDDVRLLLIERLEADLERARADLEDERRRHEADNDRARAELAEERRRHEAVEADLRAQVERLTIASMPWWKRRKAERLLLSACKGK